MKKLLCLFPVLFLTACVNLPEMDEVLEDRKVEYKKTTDVSKDLEVPPDLTSDRIDETLVVPDVAPSGSATYSDYAGERKPGARVQTVSNQAVLPKIEGIELKRDGNKRWLVVSSSPDDVWPVLLSFWQENGILLLEQDPEVGIMRTAWLENRADIKSDFITDTLKKALGSLYATGMRDQFRVRLEQGGKENTTELYLTHRGMEEKVIAGSTNEGEQSVWSPRPTDHGLEAVMIRRIMVHLGVTEKRADAMVAQKGSTVEKRQRAELLRNRNEVGLRINEDIDRSWRLTGMALDRVGFAVEDRNRSDGVYFVRYNDPYADQKTDEGLLSKLKFWNDAKNIDKVSQYQVRLSDQTSYTEVAVYSDKGQRDNSQTAARILTLLHEQMR